MTVWYPVDVDEWLKIVDLYVREGVPLRLLSHEHLGDEEEPMELFIYDDPRTETPVLRSATTINKELYWRT
jgi:hypothetical protein